MQHTATQCNTLQQTATNCNKLQQTATNCNKLQQTATNCKTLQHTAKHCNTLQHTKMSRALSAECEHMTATRCNTLQHAATRCNTLQHTATCCNTLQHTGMSRALSTAECEQMNLPTGSFSLLMSKHEIDGAAKDVKNTHFPQSFSFEVFWHYLQVVIPKPSPRNPKSKPISRE